jgi:hypothetical protein
MPNNSESLKDIKSKKEILLSNQSDKQESFMPKLRSIKINAPEDFAANLDLYLSGKKREGTDIH